MSWSARILRGFGRIAIVGASITGGVVSISLVMAAVSWFFLEFDSVDLHAALKAESDRTIGYYEAAYLTSAREAKIIPPRWAAAPPIDGIDTPKGFEIITETVPKPWEVHAFSKFVEAERRWRSTKDHLNIAAVVGMVGVIMTTAIWVVGWVIAGFFT